MYISSFGKHVKIQVLCKNLINYKFMIIHTIMSFIPCLLSITSALGEGEAGVGVVVAGEEVLRFAEYS